VPLFAGGGAGGVPYNRRMAQQGVVLFAHGARDPRWAEPFHGVAARMRALRPDLPVALAYLEHLQPDLITALKTLAGQGVTRVRIVPLFFGRGGHLREDFPRILDAARAATPTITLDVSEAAGESAPVQDALADFALHGLPSA
jgi:sirohydrochlorin cobaltochelatase